MFDPAVALDAAKQSSGSGSNTPHRPSHTDACLHLTCTNVDQQSLDETLRIARSLGIRNILALRGDPPRGEEYWIAADSRFQLASDLVKYIKQRHPGYFCVGVAAYPEGHCDALEADVPRDIRHLKAKQDAGADFIITQLFYDVDVFLAWYKQCRQAGITIPILPGVMPIQNYSSFRRMTNLCKATVPSEVLQALEPIRFDDAAVKAYGVQLSIKMIARLYLEADIRGFHLCTLNLEKSVRRVLEGLGWVAPGSTDADSTAEGPVPAAPIRDYRTLTTQALQRLSQPTSTVPSGTSSNPNLESLTSWDEFPNGRFGDARSPAFGEIDGYGVSLKVPPQDALRIWGYPVTEDDVSLIFSSYLLGRLSCIPWCDAPIFDETLAIRKWLLALNLPPSMNGKGWWTVGSQPAVDGCSSTDPTYGFGPRDGYVYQKSFVEFFMSAQDKDLLKQKILTSGNGSFSYFAGNRRGEFESNMTSSDVDAVTWGVFPGKEIAQPTIIEEESFKAWRDEAFGIWNEWEMLFNKNSATGKLLRVIGEERWLVTVVHHDYKDVDALWRFLIGGDADVDVKNTAVEKDIERRVVELAPGGQSVQEVQKAGQVAAAAAAGV